MRILAKKPTFRYLAAITFILFSLSAASIQAQGQARAVTIKTEPGAKVWLDGVLYGTTSDKGSLEISAISPGRKVVRVRADGFAEVQKPLLATQKGTISIPLTKTTDEAELAFQSGERLSLIDRDKAVAAYEQAISLKPDHVDAFIGLARIYAETGAIDKAEKAIANARKSRPGLAEASAIEGRVLRYADEPKAIAAFQRAIKEGKGFQPEAYTGLGLQYKDIAENFGSEGNVQRETASYDQAAKYFGTALKQLGTAPDAVVLYQFLGMIYERQKKNDKAIAVYQEFLSKFPGHPETEAFQSFIVQLKKQNARNN